MEKTAALQLQRGTGEDSHIMAAKRNWIRWPHYGSKEKPEKMASLHSHIKTARKN